MKWRGRRESSNVEDVRGQSSSGGMGGGGLLGLLAVIGRTFGFKGILIALVLGAIAWKMGIIGPSALVGSDAPVSAGPVEASPEEQERFDFVKVVLADTEDVWTKEFARLGRNYELPQMKVYRGRVGTGCGGGSAEMGPFYCPADRTVYIDLSFYDELARTFRSPGDFAQAYVIAHEVGHHVQKLLGTSDKVAAMQGRPDYNEYSVRLELQADFLAGVWANHSRQYLEAGDIEEAMRAANAIGDDAIQKKMQGRVVPHSFTHGTSEQRMRWFMKGLKSGRLEDGDTFSMPYRDL
ncbi:KPN_02809 family neutral zinc metallopeptidase [Luteolibacter marinus]|uniref:KPN_02809 family neutral zinc metallopeptidase n=1 Tax=Luteolibacter marinus TaxID=2776705 RepID=UPI0018686132|nr:neutral zinc metallopeptidase [Luteolibacter marinus]